MNYFKDLVIADVFALRFKKYWYMGKQCYALMLTEDEFEFVQGSINDMLKERDEHRRDN
jgi:hypothetical protein